MAGKDTVMRSDTLLAMSGTSSSMATSSRVSCKLYFMRFQDLRPASGNATLGDHCQIMWTNKRNIDFSS